MKGGSVSRNIKIMAISREELDVRLYVLALVAFVRQLQSELEPQDADAVAKKDPSDGDADD
jgi:hypothetical protein